MKNVSTKAGLVLVGRFVKKVLLAVTLIVGLVAFESPVSSYAQSCTTPTQKARAMVENFVLNPRLRAERIESGIESYALNNIEVVSDTTVCSQLHSGFSSRAKERWAISYFKLGPMYIVTAVIKQPDTPGVVRVGISQLYVFDSNLDFVKGYGG